MADAWSDKKVERLRQLAADHLSATEIAAAMGDTVTRNAVIGQCERRGIPFGKRKKILTAPKADPKPQRPKRSFITPPLEPFPRGGSEPPPVAEAPPPSVAGRPTFITVGRCECRWPIDNPEPGAFPSFFACGAKPTVGASPYCEEHRALGEDPRKAPKLKPGAWWSR